MAKVKAIDVSTDAGLPSGWTGTTRSTVATVQDHEGLIKNCLAEETRVHKGRRGENLFSATENILDAAWVAFGGATKDLADKITLPTSTTGQVYQNIPTDADRTYVFSAEIKVDSGTEKFRLKIYSGGDRITSDLTATTTWQRFSHTYTTSVNSGTATHAFMSPSDSSGATLRVKNMQFEDVTGQTNQNPSEYVSVGVPTDWDFCANGTFDSNDETGWTLVDGGSNTAEVTGNELKLTCAAADYTATYGEYDLIEIADGEQVTVEGDFTSTVSLKARVVLYSSSAFQSQTHSITGTSGSFSHTFTSTAASSVLAVIRLQNGGDASGNTVTFDNVKIYRQRHNSGIDAVKYFATTNPWTVSGNVATEGSSTPLTGMSILLEPQRENKQLNSEDMSAASWNTANASVTTDQVASPDGTSSADLVDVNTTSAAHELYPNTVSLTASTAYVFSIFAKANELSFIQITESTGFDSTTYQNYNLSTGALGNSGGTVEDADIEEYDNGWYRCWLKATASGSNGNIRIAILEADTDSRRPSYAGTTGEGVYLWGSQLEEGDKPSSYITTAGTAVTRNADTAPYAPLTTPQSAGTVVVEFESPPADPDSVYSLVSFDNTTLQAPILHRANNNFRIDDGPNTADKANLSDTTHVAATWDSTNGLNIGIRGEAGGWETWASNGTYDGGFSSDSLVYLGYSVNVPLYIKILDFYDDEKTTSWIESNYPPSAGPTGTGAVAAGAHALSGSGTVEHDGTGAVAAGAHALAGTGQAEHGGTGAVAAGAHAVAGTGTIPGSEHTGTGAVAAGAHALAGTGTGPAGTHNGTGFIHAAEHDLSGAGALGFSGTGAIAPAATPVVYGFGHAGVEVHTGTGAVAAGDATFAGIERRVFDDYYHADVGETIYFGQTAQTIDLTAQFTNGTASSYDLSSAFPGYQAVHSLDTLPTGFTLNPLSKTLAYDGTEGSLSNTIAITGNPSLPSFTIKNASTTNIPTMVGLVFADNCVDATALGTSNGKSVKVLRWYNSGFVKHAVACGDFAEDQLITLTDTPATGANLTHADITGMTSPPTAVLTLAGIGSISLTSLLASAPHETYISTPDMVECHYRGAFGQDDYEVEFQVRLFSTGACRVLVALEQCPMYRGSAYQAGTTLDVTVVIDGTIVHQDASFGIAKQQAFFFERWLGSEQYTHYVSHDVDQIAKTFLAPTPGWIQSVSSATWTAMIQTYTPGSQGNYKINMPAGGVTGELGILPFWELSWLASNDERAWKSVKANTYSAAVYPLYWRNAQGEILKPSDTPNIYYNGIDANGAPTSGLAAGLPVSGLSYDTSHNPSMGYLWYLISGDAVALDVLMGNWAGGFMNSGGTAQTDYGANKWLRGQIRATGWATRNLSQVAAILPEGHVNLAEARQWLYAQVDKARYFGPDYPTAWPGGGLGYPWVTFSTAQAGEQINTSPWMHHFWNLAVGWGVLMEPLESDEQATFERVRDWMLTSVGGHMGASGDHCFTRFARAYREVVSDDLSPSANWGGLTVGRSLYEEWESVYTETFGTSTTCENTLLYDFPGSPISYCCQMLPAIAYARQAQIPEIETRWARVAGADNYNTTFLTPDHSRYGWGVTAPIAIMTTSANVNIQVTGGTVPNDVVNNFWTPTRDGNGDILPGSWANLPLATYQNQEWCEVVGTGLRELEDAIEAALGLPYSLIDLGTGSILKTQNAFGGGARALEMKAFYFAASGGHNDSSLNCWYHLNIEKMGTTVAHGNTTYEVDVMPSNPYDPTYPWSADYINNVQGGFSPYNPVISFPADYLPDGMPTSMHNYGGTWWDPDRREINRYRYSNWYMNVDTKQVGRRVWANPTGTVEYSTKALGFMNYDHVNNEVFGHMQLISGDRHRVFTCPSGDYRVITRTNVPGNPPLTHGWASVEMDGENKILWMGNNNGPNDQYGIYDMATRTWESTGLIASGGLSYDWGNENSALVWVPDWNKALRRMHQTPYRGLWYAWDRVTNTQEQVFPTGRPPPAVALPSTKYFYYPAYKTVIAIAAASIDGNSVYVMRTG